MVKSCCVPLLVLPVVLATASAPEASQQKRAAPRSTASASPSAEEAIEDLRLLAILNGLEIRPTQAAKLAGLAETAASRMREVDQEEQSRIGRLRDQLLAARSAALRGAPVPARIQEQVQLTQRANAQRRRQARDELAASLASRVREILTPAQGARIAQVSIKLQEELRLARVRADFQDPLYVDRLQRQVADGIDQLRRAEPGQNRDQALKRLTDRLFSGADPQSAAFRQQSQAATNLAGQVFSLSPGEFEQVKGDLARMALPLARQAIEQSEAQRARRSPPEDPFRWFAAQVLLSPRAPAVLREKRPES